MGIDGDKLRIGGYVVVAILVALLGIRLMSGGGGGSAQRLTIEPPAGARAAAPAGAETTPAGTPRARSLMVQVAGEVRSPGVYSLPAGARGQQAVERAGGLTAKADQAGVNLVAPLRDGQQVIVPRRGAAGAVAAAGSAGGLASAGAAGGAPAAPVSLSSATVEQLDSLDGIGPTLAQRIVQYRQSHGGFRSVDELRQVTGIGEKRMAVLRKAVTP